MPPPKKLRRRIEGVQYTGSNAADVAAAVTAHLTARNVAVQVGTWAEQGGVLTVPFTGEDSSHWRPYVLAAGDWLVVDEVNATVVPAAVFAARYEES